VTKYREGPGLKPELMREIFRGAKATRFHPKDGADSLGRQLRMGRLAGRGKHRLPARIPEAIEWRRR